MCFLPVGFSPKKFSKMHSFQQAECLHFMKIALALNSYKQKIEKTELYAVERQKTVPSFNFIKNVLQ
jgi:hypothetical protein